VSTSVGLDWSNGQWEPMLRDGTFVGAARNRNSSRALVSSSGANPSSYAVTRSTRSNVSMTLPTELPASPLEGVDELGGGEVANPVPGLDGGDAERDEAWPCRCPAGPTR
jgi:hypothetical protein